MVTILYPPTDKWTDTAGERSAPSVGCAPTGRIYVIRKTEPPADIPTVAR